MVDREFVVRKMRLIGEDVEHLAPIGTLPLEAYLKQVKTYLDRIAGAVDTER